MTQVAGRAGRGEFAGKVLFQTYNPDFYALESAKSQNYREFYTAEIAAREEFDYIADKNELYEYGALPEQIREMIWDTIEGQLGEKMPIKGSRPNPNTPGELFALAVAIINKYNK